MPVALLYDDRFLEHDTGLGHPERSARLRAIVDRLKSTDLWDRFEKIDFDSASMDDVLRVHDESYVQRVAQACESGQGYIDSADSSICAVSYDVALRAAGAVQAGISAGVSCIHADDDS